MDPIGIDDIDNQDRFQYLQLAVEETALRRKYANELPLFKKVVKASGSMDPNIMTPDEKAAVLGASGHLRGPRLDLNGPEIMRIFNEMLPLFLNIKAIHVRELAQGATTSRLRAPQGKFPILKLKGNTAHDALIYYVWKAAAVATAEDNTYSNAALLQMARDAIQSDRLKDRLVVCQSLDEVFTTLERSIPTRLHAIESLLDELETGAYGIITSRNDTQDVITKIDKIHDVIHGLRCIEPRLDITQRIAHGVLNSFGILYAGDISQRQQRVDGWLQEKMRDPSKFIITALEGWVENLRGNAYNLRDMNEKMGRRNKPEDRRDRKSARDPQEVRSQQVEAAGGTRRPPWANRLAGDPNATPARPAFTCHYCGSEDHRAMDCPPIVAIREKGAQPPKDLCLFCLHKKKDGEIHEIDRTKGCHIALASRQQRRDRNNDALQRDQLCYTSRMSIYCCNHCYKEFKATGGGRQKFEPRFIMTGRITLGNQHGSNRTLPPLRRYSTEHQVTELRGKTASIPKGNHLGTSGNQLCTKGGRVRPPPSAVTSLETSQQRSKATSLA